MIGVALGLFLLAGIVHLLVSTKVSYSAGENFSRLQENARYAVQVIAREARMARNLGCRSLLLDEVLETLNVVSCDLLVNAHAASEPSCSGDSFLSSEAPMGFDASYSEGPAKQGAWDNLPAAVEINWVRGDVLAFWGARGPVSFVSNAMTAARDESIVLQENNAGLKDGDLVLITDCEGTDLFTASGPAEAGTTLEHDVGSPAVNVSNLFSRAYNYAGSSQVPGTVNRAMVFPFDLRVFYVCCTDKNNGNLAANASSCRSSSSRFRPSLCEWSTNRGSSQQIASDIADIRVTYIVDTDNDGTPDTFPSGGTTPTAKWVSDNGHWPGVFGAQIELLAASADTVRADAASPSRSDWPGTAQDRLGAGLANDHWQYERFVSTVALRARAPWYVRQ